MKNIFKNDPHGWHKKCGMATFLQILILRLSKICENEAMRKFPGIYTVIQLRCSDRAGLA